MEFYSEHFEAVNLLVAYLCTCQLLCSLLSRVVSQKGVFPDLLATSGDYLRVWRVASETETRLECLLNNVCGQLMYILLMCCLHCRLVDSSCKC